MKRFTLWLRSGLLPWAGFLLLSGCASMPSMPSMPSFDLHELGQDLVLFSAVEGRILQNGVPKAGLKVERSTYWSKEKEPRQSFTITDELGYYVFPETRVSTTSNYLQKWFGPPSVQQYIYVQYAGREIEIYRQSRKPFTPDEEKKPEPIVLESDLGQATVILGDYYQVDSVIQDSGKKM